MRQSLGTPSRERARTLRDSLLASYSACPVSRIREPSPDGTARCGPGPASRGAGAGLQIEPGEAPLPWQFVPQALMRLGITLRTSKDTDDGEAGNFGSECYRQIYRCAGAPAGDPTPTQGRAQSRSARSRGRAAASWSETAARRSLPIPLPPPAQATSTTHGAGESALLPGCRHSARSNFQNAIRKTPRPRQGNSF